MLKNRARTWKIRVKHDQDYDAACPSCSVWCSGRTPTQASAEVVRHLVATHGANRDRDQFSIIDR